MVYFSTESLARRGPLSSVSGEQQIVRASFLKFEPFDCSRRRFELWDDNPMMEGLGVDGGSVRDVRSERVKKALTRPKQTVVREAYFSPHERSGPAWRHHINHHLTSACGGYS